MQAAGGGVSAHVGAVGLDLDLGVGLGTEGGEVDVVLDGDALGRSHGGAGLGFGGAAGGVGLGEDLLKAGNDLFGLHGYGELLRFVV